MKLSYPAIFYPREQGEGFTVEVPDLPGCITEGGSMADAIFMAEDAASGWLLTELENGRSVPSPRKITGIKPEGGGFVSLIALDMGAYTDKYGKKAVRKNITIPAWLNTFAEEYGINFSQALQKTLMKTYEEIRKAEDELDDYELNDKTTKK